jgi:hypothetical protein
MLTWFRAHWSKISKGLLLAGVVGVGGVELYDYFSDDCCEAGAPCCYPGSPCCSAKHASNR